MHHHIVAVWGHKFCLHVPGSFTILNRGAATAANREGCRSLNMATFAARSQQVWTLAPGRYTVRVVNRQVGWPVGLWLRSDRGDSLAAEGGGTAGETIEVEVELPPGNYLVSLPLLPTPDYLWEVKKGAR